MGTNFYAKVDRCFACGHQKPDLHIGKSSGGWSFIFHGTASLNSWTKWKEYLKDKNIVDEYDNEFKYDDFVSFVEGIKSPNYIREDGTRNRNQWKSYPKGDNMRFWTDDLGYSFTRDEFI